SSSFIVSNMVDDIITSEIFQSPGTSNHIMTAQVIPHDFHSKILPCLNYAFDALFMCTRHDNHVGGTRFSHHFCFQVASVHGFQIGHDGSVRKCLSEFAYTVQPLCQDQRSAGFKPVNSSPHGHSRSLEGFFDVGQV